MGIPVGLSNFTGAFMQAYQGTKDKQAQDARQQAQDAMNKQQFDTLQQARQIDIANAIKAGQEHDEDRAADKKKQEIFFSTPFLEKLSRIIILYFFLW